jgi:hypothetical protein
MADGAVGLSYQKGSGFGKPARRLFRYSVDEGRSWSEEIELTDGSYPYMTGANDRLLRLSNDRILCQTHAFVDKDFQILGTDIYHSDDNGRSWRRNASPMLRVPESDESGLSPEASRMTLAQPHERGINEATLVEYEPARLLLYGRTALGWLFESRSEDYGTTWSTPVRSSVRHPQAMPRLTAVPETQILLLLYNPHVDRTEPMRGRRCILAMQRSRDLGRSWEAYREIASSPDNTCWHDYPTVYWMQDLLHVAYRSGPISYGDQLSWVYTDVRYRRYTRDTLLS